MRASRRVTTVDSLPEECTMYFWPNVSPGELATDRSKQDVTDRNGGDGINAPNVQFGKLGISFYNTV